MSRREKAREIARLWATRPELWPNPNSEWVIRSDKLNAEIGKEFWQECWDQAIEYEELPTEIDWFTERDYVKYEGYYTLVYTGKHANGVWTAKIDKFHSAENNNNNEA